MTGIPGCSDPRVALITEEYRAACQRYVEDATALVPLLDRFSARCRREVHGGLEALLATPGPWLADPRFDADLDGTAAIMQLSGFNEVADAVRELVDLLEYAIGEGSDTYVERPLRFIASEEG